MQFGYSCEEGMELDEGAPEGHDGLGEAFLFGEDGNEVLDDEDVSSGLKSSEGIGVTSKGLESHPCGVDVGCHDSLSALWRSGFILKDG